MITSTPSRYGSLDDDRTPLCVPISGLFADLEAAVGAVGLTVEFHDAPACARFDILQQWLRALNSHKDSALVDMFREFAASHPGSTIVEQIEGFRQHCIRVGVACPSDLAVLLQQY